MEVGAVDVNIGWWRPGASAPGLLPDARLQRTADQPALKRAFSYTRARYPLPESVFRSISAMHRTLT